MSTLAFTITLAASIVLAATAARAQTAADTNAAAPYGVSPVDDQRIYVHGLLDQFEARLGGENSFRWDGQAWAGTDTNRLWLKSEGFVNGNGKVEDGTHELLYSRPISTYFDLQGGLRYDIDSGPSRRWAAFGIQGLAPQFFDVEATAYVSDSGHFAARAKASYDILLTQRLILQPEAELNLYSKADPGRGVGSGFADLDAGLRLRYEISRKFAPYIGVAYQQKFGGTATFARQEGESVRDVRFVFGIRSWF
jgi:copper resistance protein B